MLFNRINRNALYHFKAQLARNTWLPGVSVDNFSLFNLGLINITSPYFRLVF